MKYHSICARETNKVAHKLACLSKTPDNTVVLYDN